MNFQHLFMQGLSKWKGSKTIIDLTKRTTTKKAQTACYVHALRWSPRNIFSYMGTSWNQDICINPKLKTANAHHTQQTLLGVTGSEFLYFVSDLATGVTRSWNISHCTMGKIPKRARFPFPNILVLVWLPHSASIGIGRSVVGSC